MENIKLEDILNEYRDSKALLHLITGIGVGIFITGLFPMSFSQDLVLGIILIAVGVCGKYFAKNKED